MKHLIAFICCLSGAFDLYSQEVSRGKDQYYLYLIGDAGEPTVSSSSYMKVLQDQLTKNEQIPSAIVFLGDNIYPKGMDEMDGKRREEGEQIINAQIEIGKYASRVYFIPGNHDWQRGGKRGLEQLRNQQEYIDSLKSDKVQFLPRNGCPGPVEIQLSGQLTLVIIDSQWWLHPWEKPDNEGGECELKLPQDVLGEIENILHRNRSEGRQVVITAHHPIYTYGEHGGVFTLKEHLFPLTQVNKKFYLPLPLIGSVYPVYRKLFGNIQDTAHPIYRQFRTDMEDILSRYPNAIYAAGHEHALEYSWKDSVHYVVSGAGSKFTHVKQKGYARFAKSAMGFVRIAIRDSGEARIEYFEGGNQTPAHEVVFRIPEPIQNAEGVLSNQVNTKRVHASSQYKASAGRKKWLGENYRNEWIQDIEVPIFDFQSPHGELRIVQKGGGQQTLSLRLEDPTGKQYTLRSVEKYPEKAIPEQFRGTFAKDIVQDQISASHPYAALVVPPLAEAAGIYHTNPKVVWLDDDPRLGIYQSTFGNRMMLFEERPEGDWKEAEFFGSPDDIEGTFKVIDKLAEDNDNQVDQKFVLRNRIFDLWIGDWDRHDDQWRWAEFDKKKGKLYRPIPRDRDQVFFVNEGIIPRLASKKWALPKLQGFDYDLSWPPGFMFNARYFDRSFLTELEAEDWRNEANDLKAKLTDEAIENAIRQWPKEIYDLHGQEIINKLKARREKLVEWTMEHYSFLAREVSVVGSNKHEQFTVTYEENGDALVEVFKIHKDGEKAKKIYSRKFLHAETKEIRLFGLKGDDRFEFFGDATRPIKVRVISGKGDDQFQSNSSARPLVYAKPKGIEIEAGSRFKDRRSDDPAVNDYNRREFKYDMLAPLVTFNYNVDDGIFLGGGIFATTHGFRKAPFKSRHIFLGSYAVNTSSFNFKYNGRFTHLIGKWSGEVDLDIKSPNFVNNFFGLGNESVFDKHIDENPAIKVKHAINYYRLRFKQWSVDLSLSRQVGQHGFIKAGPTLQFVELERPEGKDRFIGDYEATLPEPILEIYKNFAGAHTSWGIDHRNNPIFTTRGIYFEQSSRWMNEFNATSVSKSRFGAHTATLALYQTFKLPAKVTFAVRASGGINDGDYQIYQAQMLDGKTELRGFRKTRFYGNSKLFFNNEVRWKLGEIHSYILPGSIGMLGFFDVGRVWYKNDSGIDPTASSGKSKVWHKGFGGGLWMTPFNLAVVSTEVAHSVEGTLFNIRLGFLF